MLITALIRLTTYQRKPGAKSDATTVTFYGGVLPIIFAMGLQISL